MMLFFLACLENQIPSSSFNGSDVYTEDASESSMGGEESATSEDAADDSSGYAWWQLAAELYIDEEGLNKDKSLFEVLLLDQNEDYVCSYFFQAQEAVLTPASFEEGYLWWRILLKDGEPGLQDPNCSRVDIPHLIQIGVGSLHVESVAIWSSIDWGEIPEPMQQDAYSAYLSLDEGSNVWVYGGAVPNVGMSDMLLEEYLLQSNTWFLRPGYLFPIDY
ncbi:MAG: hypothetical protein VX278_05970 [Myxococcota bacterium]|nr:hypothetical protein [Myxococcota bacterium]